MNVTSENHEMKTQVELYFDKELSDITFDTDSLDEWKEIAEGLGMTEQLSLTKGKESPVPFPYMNESMKRVYKTICATSVEFKEYKKTPIPLEVMKQIAFCVKENHFSKIEIWFDDKAPDPLVVGTTGYYYLYDRGYTHIKDKEGKEVQFLKESDAKAHQKKHNIHAISFQEDDKYLVARWGDVKRSFAELKEMAKERFIEKHASQMRTDIEKLTGKLKQIQDNATLYLLGEITESKATTTQDW